MKKKINFPQKYLKKTNEDIFTFCKNSSAYEYCEHWQKDRIVNIPTQVAKDC